MKNIPLFIAATHGNERIGVDALALTLQTRDDFDWILGNPRAFAKNTRFTETDQNRAGRGDLDSPLYEMRRAAEIQSIASRYPYVIDIHGTYQDTGTFLLIPNPSEANLRLASYFDIDTVIVWPSITPEMQSPMSEFFPCGIEIEVGDQTNPDNTQKLANSIENFLEMLPQYKTDERDVWKERIAQKKICEMYGDIRSSDEITVDMLSEQTPITLGIETFTPIFIGTYPYSDVIGYKIRPTTIEALLA